MRTPNTRAAHELIDLAAAPGKELRACFEEAKDIGDATVLADIAERHEVSGWPGQAHAQHVAALEEEMRRLGINAVPTFIFARKLGVSGAHPPESLAGQVKSRRVSSTMP